MADENMVIEVEPTEVTPEPGKTAEPAKVETKEAAKPDPVDELKQQLATLTTESDRHKAQAKANATRAAQAEAEANRRAAEADTARKAVTESNISAVDSAIAAAQAEAEGAARDQEAAMVGGNFKLAAELGRKAARAEARIERLEEGKADLAQRKAEPAKADGGRTPAQSDPFEQVVSNATPRAQKWLRAHPTYVTDPELSAHANLAHARALKNGFIVDSDAYFDFCEKELGLKPQEQAPAPKDEPKPKQERAKAMAAAPVSRDGNPSGGQTSPTTVTLSPGEQRTATDGTIVYNYNDPNGKFKKGDPIGIKEMARRKLALQQSGAYDRSYSDQ